MEIELGEPAATLSLEGCLPQNLTGATTGTAGGPVRLGYAQVRG